MTGPLEWRGLYRKEADLSLPESMAHPAKAAWGLAFKIIEYLEELGLLGPGGTVLDPMAGTGRFLLAAAAKGYKTIAVELEPKFVSMLEANREYASKKLGRKVEMEIIQGDSRYLGGLLAERGMISVMSPPYGDSLTKGGHLVWGKQGQKEAHKESQGREEIYGANPANIGNLPDRVIITSPPYEDNAEFGGGIDWVKANRPDRLSPSPKRRNVQGLNPGGYGEAEGQIGKGEAQETYLDAMRQVYTECLAVADVLVVVVKDPTRAGKIRELGKDTWDLLESVGWQVVDYHQAILFEVQEQGHMFDGVKRQPRGRMSFFKRLSFQRGSPVSNYEHIIFAVNPDGRQVGKLGRNNK